MGWRAAWGKALAASCQCSEERCVEGACGVGRALRSGDVWGWRGGTMARGGQAALEGVAWGMAV